MCYPCLLSQRSTTFCRSQCSGLKGPAQLARQVLPWPSPVHHAEERSRKVHTCSIAQEEASDCLWLPKLPWRLQPLTCYSGDITLRCSLMSQMLTFQLLLHCILSRHALLSKALWKWQQSFLSPATSLSQYKNLLAGKPFCSQENFKSGLSMCTSHCTQDTELSVFIFHCT